MLFSYIYQLVENDKDETNALLNKIQTLGAPVVKPQEVPTLTSPVTVTQDDPAVISPIDNTQSK